MNIIGIRKGLTSGCEYHRIILPLGFMQGIKGYVTNYITEDKIDGWDLLIYNRMHYYNSNNQNFRKIMGCKIVLDLDDYWRLPPNHVNYNDYENIATYIENNIKDADMVTVTNKPLYDKVYPLNKNVHIFPNGIPFGQNQFTPERREDDRVRIFWAGTVTHEHDIKILSGPIKRLLIYSDKIKMVIGGYFNANESRQQYKDGKIDRNKLYAAEETERIWINIFNSFTANGRLPYMKLHATEPVDYMQMYENADIMVIPLEDTEWHSCKSNLKILEAASKRIPCIVSNVAPYNLDEDCPVLWVNSQKDWFSHLNYLILNPAARIDMGNKLYDWAFKNYNLTDINERRSAAFRNLIGTPENIREIPVLT